MITLYEVGGCVRDRLMDRPTKDIDYAVEADSFETMQQWLAREEFAVFLEQPEYFTIRARFPAAWGKVAGREVNHLTADFVLCRKERGYSDGRHPDQVEVGTIFDDLARRDFTVNAIAIKNTFSGTEEILDPHNGQDDLRRNILRCVGDPWDRFNEDPLRILRAIRFSITHGFDFAAETYDAMCSSRMAAMLGETVSTERIREELLRCFRTDTVQTLSLINELHLQTVLFQRGLWLRPTLED